MKLNKTQKVAAYIFGGLIALLLIAIISINLIVGNIIESKITNALNKHETKDYHIELRKVNANILTGNINLKDIKIHPDSSFLNRLKEGETEQSVAIELFIPTFRLAGIGLYKAITSKDININKILFKGADLKLIIGEKPKRSKEVNTKKEFNIDSIYMKGLDGISIGKIEFLKSKFEIYDLVKDQVIIKNTDLKFELRDFYLKELEGNNDYFSLHLENLECELLKEEFAVPGGNYYLNFDRFYFDLFDSILEIDNLTFKPTYKDKYKLAKKLKFTSEIYDISVKKIKISAFDIERMISDGVYLIDSIEIEGINLGILMDKRFPFNEDRKPKLPHQALKHMRIPLYINKIDIKNSKLIYQEKYEGSEELMTAIMGDLNVQVHFATSIKDSIRTRKSMTVNLQANFMEKTPLSVNFDFPLYHKADTFYFSGHLASAKMSEFNKAASPAIGVKFIKGDLKEITFSGSANDKYSKGEMTMLYANLEAEVDNKDPEKDKNKFLSWVANTIVHTSNPGSNNKLRTATMEFERVPYKGFGNFVWKTLQSGIVATVTPTGKKVRTMTEDQNSDSVKSKTEEKTSKKEARKKAKEEKKKDKN
ncbi:MAG: hypothetical protein C0591_09290 [Marinilabiliales bacterium]|nr:MAG: hypothetical protein C0591_09290 [Marinilabiliales bacterium]